MSALDYLAEKRKTFRTLSIGSALILNISLAASQSNAAWVFSALFLTITAACCGYWLKYASAVRDEKYRASEIEKIRQFDLKRFKP